MPMLLVGPEGSRKLQEQPRAPIGQPTRSDDGGSTAAGLMVVWRLV